MARIQLPNSWQPRPHQLPLWTYFENGGKRGVAVWHRRAGKDSTAINITACQMVQRVGTYWHMLPEQKHARKVIWDAIDKHGRRIIDQAFPKELRESTNEVEMRIRLKNGSVWQAVGSDNYNSLVGANPVGIVFSEYSVANPAAWDFIRPILAENGGWVMFIYTARGRNHGASLFDMAKGNDKWFAQILTVDDTGILGPEVIAEERASGMSEDMIEQEYYCSFEAAVVGSYYGKLMVEAEKQGRVCRVPHEPAKPVETWWDIGVGDSTAIWFVQRVAQEIRIIDYHEMTGEGLPYYARVLQEKAALHKYNYGRHVAPHDIDVREFTSGAKRIDTARDLGIRFEIAAKLRVEEGIDAVRAMLPKCWFDAEKCKHGIEALRQYRKDYDEKLKAFRDHPMHDWTSHAADAFRYGAVAGLPAGDWGKPIKVNTSYVV